MLETLSRTPYLLAEDEAAIAEKLSHLEVRVKKMRSAQLSEETLRHYYGEKRQEQAAAVVAAHGGDDETALSALKVIDIARHDADYSPNESETGEIAAELAALAREREPIGNDQLKKLHGLLTSEEAEERGGFRSRPAFISGSRHRPPKTLEEVEEAMHEWELWSVENKDLPPLLRATVLHAWLTHIHPFLDGNGRVARAMTALELLRAGYPPINVSKKDRERLKELLSESDIAGDIQPLLGFFVERADGALRGLELSAQKRQQYSPPTSKVRQRQEEVVDAWKAGASALAKAIGDRLAELLDGVRGKVFVKEYGAPVSIDDYNSLVNRRTISRAWSFLLVISVPGTGRHWEMLAYLGHRSPPMFHHMSDVGGPSLFWSDKQSQPYCNEFTANAGEPDAWSARLLNEDKVEDLSMAELANNIAEAINEMVAGDYYPPDFEFEPEY